MNGVEYEERIERALRALAHEPVQASAEFKQRLIATLQRQQREKSALARAGRGWAGPFADRLRAWWTRPALRYAGLALLCLLLMIGFLIRPAPRALLTVHQGAVLVKSHQPSAPEARKDPGDLVSLAEGTHIRLDDTGAASLALFDANQVDLFPGTQLTLAKAQPRSVWQPQAVSLQMTAGEVRVHVSPLRSPAERFEVESPTALVSVRGTLFRVRLLSPFHTYVATDKGLVVVRLYDPTQNNPQVEVPAGHEVDAIVGQPLIVRPQATSGPLPEWKGLLAPVAASGDSPLPPAVRSTPPPLSTFAPFTPDATAIPRTPGVTTPSPTATPLDLFALPRRGQGRGQVPAATPGGGLPALPTEVSGTPTPTAVVTDATPAPTPIEVTPGLPTHTPVAPLQADLWLTHTAWPAPTAADGILTYTLLVANHGPAEARGIVLRDLLPPQVHFLNAAPPAIQNSNRLLWDLDRLAVGESRAVEIAVRVQPWVTAAFTNTAIVTAITPDDVLLNNRREVSVDVSTEADLAIAVEGLRPVVGSGSVMTCTLVYTNLGPAAARHVTVVAELAAGVAFGGIVSADLQLDPRAAATGTLGLTEFSPAVWVTPRLAAGAIGRLVFTATVLPGVIGPLTHTAAITAASPDGAPYNNRSHGATLASFVADVGVTQAIAPDPVMVGDVVTYILTYTNQGAWAAQHVSITLTLPPGVMLDESVSLARPPLAGPIRVGQSLIWFTPTLAPGMSGALVLTTTVDRRASAHLESQAVVHSATFDPNPGDNEAHGVIEVTIPALNLGGKAEPGVVAPRQPFTYTFSVTNTGAVTFAPRTVSLAALLPDGFHPIAPADGLSGTLPTATVWWNPVPLAPGASFSVTLVISATAALSPGLYVAAAATTATVPGGVLTATASISVRLALPSVAVAQQIAGDHLSIAASDHVTLTIRLTNTGPGSLDALPLQNDYNPRSLRLVAAMPEPEAAEDGMLAWGDLTGSPPHGFGRDVLPGEALTVMLTFDVIRSASPPHYVESRIVVGPLRDVHGNVSRSSKTDVVVYEGWRLYLPLLLRIE